MCGIAGIINLDGEISSQAIYLHRMTNQMKKRGPDDEGYILINIEENNITTLFGNDKESRCLYSSRTTRKSFYS